MSDTQHLHGAIPCDPSLRLLSDAAIVQLVATCASVAPPLLLLTPLLGLFRSGRYL